MRKILLSLYAILTLATAHAQCNVRELWLAMPDTLQSYDNLDEAIDTVTADYMSVRMSSSMTMELRLLPSVDTLLCLVRTYETQDGESDIRFYNMQWQRIDDNFGLPTAADGDSLIRLLTSRPDTMTTERYNELCLYFDPIMLIATLSPEDCYVSLTLSTPMLRRDETEALKAIIRQKKFKWNGEMFN